MKILMVHLTNQGKKINRRKVDSSSSSASSIQKQPQDSDDTPEKEVDFTVEDNQQNYQDEEMELISIAQAVSELNLEPKKRRLKGKGTRKSYRRHKSSPSLVKKMKKATTTRSDIELVLEIKVDQRMTPFAVHLNEDYHEAALRFCRENQLHAAFSENVEATIRQNVDKIKDERKTVDENVIQHSGAGSVLILDVDIGDLNGPRECRAQPDDDLLLVSQNFCAMHGLPKESVEILQGLLETNMKTLQTEIRIAKLKQRRHVEQTIAIEGEKMEAERKEAQRWVDALADEEQKRRIAWHQARKTLHRRQRSW